MKLILNNKKIKFIFALFLLFACLPLFGQLKQLGQQKTFPSKEIKSILIKTMNLNLKIKKVDSILYTIKWTGDLFFQTNEGILTIQSSGFNSKRSWDVPSSKNFVTLEISGPARPVQLFAFSSKISFSQWTKPVFISSFKGNIKTLNTKGPWEISLKEGNINIHQHQGSLSVQGFHLKNLLTSSKGYFQFYINEGLLKMKKSKGELHFTTDKADIQLTQFKGSLKGFSQSGAITSTVQPETVELFTKKSPLRVYFMGQQAPMLTAYTEKGRIYGPRYLHKQFSGKSTTVSGRIRGSLKKGKVFLKSKTGNIYIN